MRSVCQSCGGTGFKRCPILHRDEPCFRCKAEAIMITINRKEPEGFDRYPVFAADPSPAITSEPTREWESSTEDF